jgi:hypothetical protein
MAAALTVGMLCITGSLTGCGPVRETLPDRSAMEQLLISTAADRAVAGVPGAPLKGKAVFVDAANLECLDKPYVVQRVRQAVLEAGGRLAQDREEAQLALEVASGALSIDKRNYLLGIPEIAIPMPFAGGAITLPEIALFKLTSYRAKAKLLFNAVDTKTNAMAVRIPVRRARALTAYWKVLFIFGPYEWTDLPEAEGKADKSAAAGTTEGAKGSPAPADTGGAIPTE